MADQQIDLTTVPQPEPLSLYPAWVEMKARLTALEGKLTLARQALVTVTAEPGALPDVASAAVAIWRGATVPGEERMVPGPSTTGMRAELERRVRVLAAAVEHGQTELAKVELSLAPCRVAHVVEWHAALARESFLLLREQERLGRLEVEMQRMFESVGLPGGRLPEMRVLHLDTGGTYGHVGVAARRLVEAGYAERGEALIVGSGAHE